MSRLTIVTILIDPNGPTETRTFARNAQGELIRRLPGIP